MPDGEILSHWLLATVLWEVVGATTCGAIAGYAAGKVLEWAAQKGTARRPSFLAYSLALSLAVLGGAKLTGTDGILAVFVAGVAVIVMELRASFQAGRVSTARRWILPVSALRLHGLILLVDEHLARLVGLGQRPGDLDGILFRPVNV